MKRRHFRFWGTVQGVGFRPALFRTAHALGLTGTIENTAQGVSAHLQGERVDSLIGAFKEALPPLASIDRIESEACAPRPQEDRLEILSTPTLLAQSQTHIPPDSAPCAACESELFDPRNRRFGYPFISCSDCGPRFTIIHALPYDRRQSTLADFKLCTSCEAEYHDPLNRRYHAQPIGCHDCGPFLSFKDSQGAPLARDDEAIKGCIEALKAGQIVALKGVGGFQLLCDAHNPESLTRLRQRKRRPDKPFAVLLASLEAAAKEVTLCSASQALLSHQARPIVIADQHPESTLAPEVAPGLSRLGVMLPASGLHHLIARRFGRALVATSANLSGDPIIAEYERLERDLKGVYDRVLDHNRAIANPCDDSVVQIAADAPLWLRRARGVMPLKLTLPRPLSAPTLALGAHLKSAIALGFERTAILGPFIGDLEGVQSVARFEKSIERLCGFYRFEPEVVSCDRHPGYASSRWAHSSDRIVKPVYHHHAHALAVMAEHHTPKALAVCWDGTGLGEDGTLWGGEFLHCTLEKQERIAHLHPISLIGAEAAIKEIDRIAIALLLQSGIDNHPLLNSDRARMLASLYHRRINTPLSSAAGRLFDGIARLSGLLEQQSYEGQSGLLIERAYRPGPPYPFELNSGVLDWRAMVPELLNDSPERIAGRFLATLCEMIATVCAPFKVPIVLCGGVFQNRILVNLVYDRLTQMNKTVLLPRSTSPNDSGIALGQLAAQMEREDG